MDRPLRVLVAGCGNMGASHARAYHRLTADFQIAGLVSRGPESRERLAKELGGLPTQEQRDALSVALQRHTRRSARDAEEEMILGRWLVTECKGAEAAIARLSRRLCKLDRAGSFEPLMWVLNDVGVAARDGMLSDRQKDALAEIARTFKLS